MRRLQSTDFYLFSSAQIQSVSMHMQLSISSPNASIVHSGPAGAGAEELARALLLCSCSRDESTAPRDASAGPQGARLSDEETALSLLPSSTSMRATYGVHGARGRKCS